MRDQNGKKELYLIANPGNLLNLGKEEEEGPQVPSPPLLSQKVPLFNLFLVQPFRNATLT